VNQPIESSPVRLVDDGLEVGRLLRAAMAQPGTGPDEAQCWAGLGARRQRRASHRRAAGAGLALAAAVALLVPALRRHEPPPVAIGAEPAVAALPATSASASAVPSQSPPPRVRRVPVVPSASAAAGADTSDCVRMARAGDYASAIACYEGIASGQGVGAELALYEKARLEARALGNPAAALRTLEQHRQRFGSGSLGTEVAMTRIELLVASGRSTEALAAVDEALQSSAARERSGDLHAVRGDLLRGGGDCAGALVEYGKAEAAGVRTSRLARGRALCAPDSIDGGAAPEQRP
jgi:hypothetical protein